MEGISSVNSSDGVEDDASTRPGSSRLSLGSSPSELSDDDGNTGMNEGPDDDFALDDGEGSLTPTEKIVMDEDDNDQLPVAQPPARPSLSPSHDRQPAVATVTAGDDNAVFDDGLFEDSSDTLSNAPMDMDDRDDEDDEEEPLLSSLSLTGDNAPLSPDPEQHEHESKEEEEDDDEDDKNEQQQKGESDTTVAKEEKQQQQQQQQANGIVNEPQEDVHMKDEEGDSEKAQTKSTMSPVEESSAAAAATTSTTAAAEPSSSNSTPPSPTSMLPGDKNENQQQTKISDNDNDTSPTPQSPTTPSSRKRRGSQSLEDEEWQQRRSSKMMELKEQQNGSDHVPEGSQLPSSSEAEPKEEPNQEQEDKPEKDEGMDLFYGPLLFIYISFLCRGRWL